MTKNLLLQEHLPYADDSTAVTPKSELNGGIVVDTPTKMGLSRSKNLIVFFIPYHGQFECTRCNKMTSFQILRSNICVLTFGKICRKYSYNSHTGKESYTSHTDVR